MKTCPDCGTANNDLSGFCSRCSAELPRELNISSAPIAHHAEQRQAFDPEASETEKLIKRTESRLSDISNQALSHRCGLAGALSALLPGLGQIYAGDIVKGMAMVIGWVVGGFFYGRWCVNSMIRGAKWGELGLEFSHFLVGLVFVGFWIYAVVDAVGAPERVR